MIADHSQQQATGRFSSPKEIAISLLTGAHEINHFDELFRYIPAKAKAVINALLDETRPLHIRIGQLECQVKHLKEKRNANYESGTVEYNYSDESRFQNASEDF